MRRELVTTADIALRSGVSRAAVSYVLNGKPGARISEATRERIRRVAEELGYRGNSVATALRTGRTNSIGLISAIGRSPVMADLSANYLRYLFLELSLAAAHAGMGANTFVDSLEMPLKLDGLLDGTVDGVIFFAQYEAGDWVRAVNESGMPCVEIGSTWGPYQVHQDTVRAVKDIVEYLVSIGHRRIGHWKGPKENYAAGIRAATFRAAMNEAGIAEDASPIVSSPDQFMRVILRKDRPTAFFAYMDAVAITALDLIHDAGLTVPGDISLVGYDNDLRATTARPALTTVQNPMAGMAEAAVKMLVAQMHGEDVPSKMVLVPAPLVIRGSTMAIPTL